jgi:hypothetical protein
MTGMDKCKRLKCEFCQAPAKYTAKAAFGPVLTVCLSCSDLGPSYSLTTIQCEKKESKS